MVIYTLQLSKWRLAKAKGILAIDITVKSGINLFAPDWDFLMAYKNSPKGPDDEEAYRVAYIAKLNRGYRENPQAFLELFQHELLVVMCYCPEGVFCHRHLFVTALQQMARKLNLPFLAGGELTALP